MNLIRQATRPMHIFYGIHVVIPSSGHGKSQSGERYLNHDYELRNLLQFKYDVSYLSFAHIVMVLLLKCYLLLTQRHLVTFLRLQKLGFRIGLWQFPIKHNLFTIFTLIPNNSMKNYHGSLSYCFFACVITVKKRNFQLKNIFDNIPCSRDYVVHFSSLRSYLMGESFLTNMINKTHRWGISKRKT